MDMLKVAKEYIEKGWCVLPVGKGMKSPMVNWKEYQHKRPSEQEIKQWFEGKSNKDVGICVVTGKISGITVIDIDHKTRTFGFNAKYWSKTGSGNKHLFYKYKEGYKTTTRVNGDPVDIRNDGGVIVLPPTIHPSGNQYEWQLRDELMEMPYIEMKAKPASSVTLAGKPGNPLSVSLEEFHNMGRGGRNDLLTKIVGILRNEIYDVNTLNTIVRHIARSAKEPLPEHEVTALIQQAINWNVKDLPLTVYDMKTLLTKRDELRRLEKIAPSTGYRDLDREITGFLPGNVYMLSGETNSGKTMVAANFAHNVAKQGKRVLYIALEPQERILDYVCSIDHRIPFHKVDTEKTMKMSQEASNIEYITNCMGIEQLSKLLESAQGYALIIIDHIGYFVSGGKGDSLQKQQDLMKKLPTLAKDKKSAILAIAHVRKGESSKTKKTRRLDMFDISGSGAFIQDATDVLMIRRYFADEFDEDSREFSQEGSLSVVKTKTPQKGARGYCKLKFVQDSALITDEVVTPGSVLPEKILGKVEDRLAIFDNM